VDAEVDCTLQLLRSQPFGMAVDKAWKRIVQSLWMTITLKSLELLHLEEPGLHDCSYIFTSLAATKLKRLRVIGGSGIEFLQTFSPNMAAQNRQQNSLEIPSLAIEGWSFDEFEDNGTCVLVKTCLENGRKG
jgi:hypothetical protein